LIDGCKLAPIPDEPIDEPIGEPIGEPIIVGMTKYTAASSAMPIPTANTESNIGTIEDIPPPSGALVVTADVSDTSGREE
jgi:hypothetical protein